MLLLITGSLDGTSDLLISRLGKQAFRLNYDLFAEYDLAFTPQGWLIKNPAGHSISSETITSAFWWKAFNYFLVDQDQFVVEEVKYILRELYNWCRLRGIAKGNPPDFHNRLGKINLLHIAARYFSTPTTLASFRLAGTAILADTHVVAKSFSSGLTVTNRALMTTAVDLERLDPAFPWFLQERIEGNADVTVFVSGEELFAYERDRSKLKGLDWRPEQSFNPEIKEWIRLTLTAKEEESVRRFCDEIDVDWGRLDFMKTGHGLVFLEFNANGQWVFLDYQNEDGLLDSVVNYLRNQGQL